MVEALKHLVDSAGFRWRQAVTTWRVCFGAGLLHVVFFFPSDFPLSSFHSKGMKGNASSLSSGRLVMQAEDTWPRHKTGQVKGQLQMRFTEAFW